MAGTRRLTELAHAALGQARFPDGPLTIALSGGADSASLAWLASRTGRDTRALHVDHSLPGSASMQDAANEIASTLDLELTIVDVELKGGPSPEAVAREARYEAFTATDDQVLTAHTAEDNAETVLINMTRGTGLKGLAGIPYHRPPNVWRPILAVDRSTTREIATLAGLPFRDDPANSDPGITRNRVRTRLLPALREFNPKIEATLNQMASNLRGDSDYLESLADGDLSPELPIGVVLTMPHALSNRLLVDWLRFNGVVVSAPIVDRVWEVVRGESPSRELLDGAVVTRRGAVVEISRVG